MTAFRNPKTCAAYCDLLTRCGDEIATRALSSGVAASVLDQLIGLIQREGASCSWREARDWFHILKTEPFLGLAHPRMADLLKPFAARVALALQEARGKSTNEAMRWVEFVEEQAISDLSLWCREALAEARHTHVPQGVAARAFEVLKELADDESVALSETLLKLEELELGKNFRLWSKPEFREALWACVSDDEPPDDRIWICLRSILDLVLDDPELLHQWGDVALELEGGGIQMFEGETAEG